VSRREEDYYFSFDFILNNKHTADRMFQQFIDLSNAFDEEWELKEKKEQIVQFFSIQHAQFLDVVRRTKVVIFLLSMFSIHSHFLQWAKRPLFCFNCGFKVDK